MKKITKIYNNFIDYCENINPEEKKEIENIVIKVTSLVGIISFFIFIKMLGL
jgi:hypothetical protein